MDSYYHYFFGTKSGEGSEVDTTNVGEKRAEVSDESTTRSGTTSVGTSTYQGIASLTCGMGFLLGGEDEGRGSMDESELRESIDLPQPPKDMRDLLLEEACTTSSEMQEEVQAKIENETEPVVEEEKEGDQVEAEDSEQKRDFDEIVAQRSDDKMLERVPSGLATHILSQEDEEDLELTYSETIHSNEEDATEASSPGYSNEEETSESKAMDEEEETLVCIFSDENDDTEDNSEKEEIPKKEDEKRELTDFSEEDETNEESEEKDDDEAPVEDLIESFLQPAQEEPEPAQEEPEKEEPVVRITDLEPQEELVAVSAFVARVQDPYEDDNAGKEGSKEDCQCMAPSCSIM